LGSQYGREHGTNEATLQPGQPDHLIAGIVTKQSNMTKPLEASLLSTALALHHEADYSSKDSHTRKKCITCTSLVRKMRSLQKVFNGANKGVLFDRR
jgi:hypothetical protein